MQQNGTWQNNLYIALDLLQPLRFERELLYYLQFKELQDREENIHDAYSNTFQWIFSVPSQYAGWSSFVDWMTSDQSLYWITGKAGAGKSTLMKMVCRDPRTRQLLSRWGDGRKVQMFSHYFWNSGTALQMSHEGLVRSMICQALEDMPNLSRELFPRRFEIYILFGGLKAWKEGWSWSELMTSFRRLKDILTRSMKMAFFIDGLDEFSGNKTELIDFIHEILGKDVKFCVSSRPWTVFEDAFKQSSSLRLNQVTQEDIKTYVESKFAANAGFQVFCTLDRQSADRLLFDIAGKSAGIFLWVVLVVQSLLSGLTDGEKLTDLQKRLEALPPRLEDLFWKMLKSVDEWHYKRACEFFQIQEVMEVDETLLVWSLADDESHEKNATIPSTVRTQAQMNAEAEMMRRRLNACTRGLLEPSKSGKQLCYQRVGMLHRTVRDFMARRDIRKEIRETTGDEFNPAKRLSRAYCALMKTTHPSLAEESNRRVFCRDNASYAVHYASKANWKRDGDDMNLYYDIDSAGSIMGSRFLDDKTYWVNYLIGLSNSLQMKSFLQAAVVWQLVPYIRSVLRYERFSQDDLDDLLFIALTEWSKAPPALPALSLYHDAPSAEVVQLLVKRGANPHSHRFYASRDKSLKQIAKDVGTKRSEIKVVFDRPGKRNFSSVMGF